MKREGSISREAWFQETSPRTRLAKRVSDSFIAEYRDVISKFDEAFERLCDLEDKLSRKSADLWEGLSKEGKEEVGSPRNYRTKLNAMQQWWSKRRPKGKANYPLTLPKDRKDAAWMIESEIDVMSKLLKYGEKELEKMKSQMPEVTEPTEDNPPVENIFTDMG